MRLMLCPSRPEDYQLFLKCKRLPRCRFAGEFAEFPDEYLPMLGLDQARAVRSAYVPMRGLPLFDYQRDIMPTMPAACVDVSVFSPPFPALFAYTGLEEDIGNSEDIRTEAKLHLGWFYRQMARIVKPGRVIVVHVAQIPKLKRTGELGTVDFRGMNIRIGQRSGLIYCYDWLISKNPQTEAIRTHSHTLQFASLLRDRVGMHGQHGDYLIKFRAPGENKVPVNSENEVSRQNWIDWAESAWPWRGEAAIRQGFTLNTKMAKGENDTKHICPLQLDVIERIVRLYSNPGEIVFSPFAGIGSEGDRALRLRRRFYGCELKNEYHAQCLINLERAIRDRDKGDAALPFEAMELERAAQDASDAASAA
jgi:hypothetical protein